MGEVIMANGKKSFLDLFRVEDEIDDEYDEEDEDIFDEEDDDEDDYEDTYKPTRKPKKSFPSLRNNNTSNSGSTAGNFNSSSSNSPSRSGYSSAASQRRYSAPTSTATDKLVSFSAPERKQSNYRPSSEVYVIKPAEFDDAQTVTDFLKKGRAIVINMEGLSLEPAQRIIDFIGGACYGLGGELKAISANIFIAVPNNIEVSGDLREEILNSSNLSPNLGN